MIAGPIAGLIAGLIARGRSLWRGIAGRAAIEADMQEEFRSHLELRAADLVRAGATPDAARRQARLEFGCAELHKDDARAARGLRSFDELRVSVLDLKLGARMLVKYPGLTLVGGLAIAFAIAVGAATFEYVGQLVAPTIPLPEGSRIVGVRLWDAAASTVEPRLLHDLSIWREESRTLVDLGVYRSTPRNLIVDRAVGAPIDVAEISASAFRLTRVAPELGRTLVAADEAPGAPAVVVIGHDVWRVRFASDPAVIGRTVRVGNVPATVVGVMPAGYAFPEKHAAWVPLHASAVDYPVGRGPALARAFARLAPGASLGEAQRELAALGARHVREFPPSWAQTRPQVQPWGLSVLGISGLQQLTLMSSDLFLGLLLVLVCGNVAMLMFARAATRDGEIVVRTALGASRGRIVTQLFAEALVLGTLASALGLGAAALGLKAGMRIALGDGPWPFWMHDRLSPATVVYCGLLTLLVAVLTGVLPALKITRGIAPRLRQAAAGGGGPRFGGIWTAVIVCQVAVTVVFPVVAFFARRDGVQLRTQELGLPAREYLTASIEMDRDLGGGAVADSVAATRQRAARFAATAQQLAQRLAGEPAVLAAAFTSRVPARNHVHRRVEVEADGAIAPGARGATPADTTLPHVNTADVDPGYFATLGAPALAGRVFHPADATGGRHAIVVNQSFVRDVLHGRSPIGQRVRYVDAADPDADRSVPVPPGPWLDIVGVVRDLGMVNGADPTESGAGIYQPIAIGDERASDLIVHVRGDPAAFALRLRSVVAEVDPALRLDELLPLDRMHDESLRAIAFTVRLLVTMSAFALLLSLAGVYAVVAFTVSRRTREIGIRVALGSDRRRLVASILRRPLTQVGGGVAIGGVLAFALASAVAGGLPSVPQMAIVAVYSTAMLGVCLLACAVPARRALRVEPTEALRTDG